MGAELSAGLSKRNATVWIAGMTLLALVLRLINANSGLWLDELYSLVNQFRLSPFELFGTYVGDNQHPL